ncbi:MAG: DNA topoisomerase (ATP-hydrolyzing) subunit B [Ilumatobacteraceae bacterium]|jgi:DNA gyrase subunit B|nr:DNA topoisomerase (ATP-hydrolyzing) subunit B [Actinomycetota bacterium]NCZ55385.1 DNA topoisomerase (ATP-hydrolyzing) subunit B [Acidimicrobiia bacterium]NCZ67088.1 DNA topoisomerase (ATP-hydrolyzing) subunit B [Acidimicrobiia bacterium]NDA00917.1 DNA topoisomerase (ATP-hydrolyzing) subunit B [Acidimicrobiia bacterium]NDD60887.1 DNA topoisomerase (ATP-hydrolyzing) subunit B [Actinomycetota bacterium]
MSVDATKGTTRKGSASYGAKDIQVLEGLDPVRRRPGMYIGSTGLAGLHHLIWEVVDNSVDEAMAGFCNKIIVTLHPDGSCEVVDNGRGIPVDPYPSGPHKGKSALEVVLTVLHAGGKFGGDGYKVSGGLHGVGVSVVNALSLRVVAEVHREGTHFRQEFVEGGKPKGKLQKVGASPEKTQRGTSIRFWPDPEIFKAEGTEFVARTVTERLQTIAFLNKNLEVVFVDDRGDKKQKVTFQYKGGIVDFVKHLNQSREALFTKVAHYEASEDDQTLDIALQWNTGYYEGIYGYANGISTVEGGMHVEGFKTALTSVLNKYARSSGGLKEKDENLLGEDIREGLTAVVSVKLREPQFEGQTKAKLGNVSMRSFVQKETNTKLEEWLQENPTEANRVVKKAVAAAQARIAAKNARNAIRRKTALSGAGMPDKLKDCTSGDPGESELFIVEGDSAGGTAVDARDPRTQAILPIRGKILNVERARLDKMLKNNEIQALITAIGGGVGNDEFNVEKARYHKVIILADADVDGSHIRTLLLTFFYRQMRPMVESGFIYIAQPPLYSTEVGKEKVYLKDDAAKNAFLKEHANHKKEFQRLKGLGEMDWQELKGTTMDAATRTLLQITVDEAAEAENIMSVLMGDDVEMRKEFITTNARDVRNLDF